MLILLVLGFLIGYICSIIGVLKAEVTDNKSLSLGMAMIICYICLFWPMIFPMIIILWIDENFNVDLLRSHECSKSWKGKIKKWLRS